MRRIVAGIILSTALGATGCATSGHRDSVGTMTSRSDPWSPKTTAPAQTRMSLPPEQPDLFMPSADSSNHRGLNRFFPTLGRNTSPRPDTTARVVSPATSRPMPAPLEVAAHTNPGRPSLFNGSRKPRAPQTYVTDVRSSRVKSPVSPAFLPVALQIPVRREADQAVTPTSADMPEKTDDPDPKSSEDREPIPTNPDASDATATPLSQTEPQLAIDPMEVGDSLISPPPATESPAITPSAEAATLPLADAPEQSGPAPTPRNEPAPTPRGEPSPTPRDEPAHDPRERPRLSARPTVTRESSSPVEPAAEPTKPEPAATVATPTTKPDVATDVTRVAQARPSVADPGNSLGLPPVTLPATYNRQYPGSAPRGSGQADQPPPVLASPQIAPIPQGGHTESSTSKTGGTTTRTWRVPSVRRLVRRIGGLGEFATPPTAKPH